MITTLKKSGNGLAIPIPKAIAELFNCKEGTEFEVSTENDRMVIRARDARLEKFEAVAAKVLVENESLFRSLADK